MKRFAQAIAVTGIAAASIVPLTMTAHASQPAPSRVAPMGVCPPGDCGPYGTAGACEVNRGEVIAAGGRVSDECYWYGVVGPEYGWHFHRFS